MLSQVAIANDQTSKKTHSKQARNNNVTAFCIVILLYSAIIDWIDRVYVLEYDATRE